MRHLYVPKPALSREGRAKAAKATRAEQDVQQQDVQQQDQSSLRRWLGRGLRAMKAALPAPAQRLLLTRPTIEQQERPPSPASAHAAPGGEAECLQSERCLLSATGSISAPILPVPMAPLTSPTSRRGSQDQDAAG